VPKHISRETKEAIVREYRERPVRQAVIAEKYGVSIPSVVKILSQYGVPMWGMAQLFSPDLDEGYFEEINSQDKAYFLGYITTDGCVFWKDAHHAFLTMELHKKDRCILEAFMKAVRCNRKLVTNQRRDTVAATVTSTRMVRDLEKYCVRPRSSLTQKFWDAVPDEYLASYMRGLVDGDGSFGFYARPGRSVHKKAFRMCSGSRDFIDAFVDKMADALGVSTPRIHVDAARNLYDTGWIRNDDLETIIGFLYSTDGLYLARKKEVADRIVDEIRQHRDNGRLTAS